jgi:hypothetical protein
MSWRSSKRVVLPAVVGLLLVGCATRGAASDGGAARRHHDSGRSPAICGTGDKPEPGIQGEVPAGATADYNCGLQLVGQLPIAGAVTGAGHCAYVRGAGGITVIDVSDPAKPVEVGTLPTVGSSESTRAAVTRTRAVLVSGSGLYDISNCRHPVLKGEIPWPKISVAGIPIPVGLVPHDLTVNHAGTKVFASFGMFEANIADLENPSSWTVADHTCDIAKQFWPAQEFAAKGGVDLCAGHNGATSINWGAEASQAAVLWPALGHGPATNGNDTRLYMAPVGGGEQEGLQLPRLSIIDTTTNPPRVLDQIRGAGYGIDWFQQAHGAQYLLHNREEGVASQVNVPGDTCVPERRRPDRLGWAYEGFLTDVTHDKAKDVSILEVAINAPQFCAERKASGHDPVVGYHSIDNPNNAKLALLDYGDAGLRVFDIRKPRKPSEVAYFNHGTLFGPRSGAPYYDASRGLIYMSDSGGFKVLQVEARVRGELGLAE